MQFCPICSNLLLVETGPSGLRFCCQTCPYVSDIEKRVSIVAMAMGLGGQGGAWLVGQRCFNVCLIPRHPGDWQICKTMKLKRKEVDDVLGGEEAWASANRTTSNCPFCDNNEVSIRARRCDAGVLLDSAHRTHL
jgi:DNA-directed RNA polymerase subunit M/transcription elongation factor TFIIS